MIVGLRGTVVGQVRLARFFFSIQCRTQRAKNDILYSTDAVGEGVLAGFPSDTRVLFGAPRRGREVDPRRSYSSLAAHREYSRRLSRARPPGSGDQIGGGYFQPVRHDVPCVWGGDAHLSRCACPPEQRPAASGKWHLERVRGGGELEAHPYRGSDVLPCVRDGAGANNARGIFAGRREPADTNNRHDGAG